MQINIREVIFSYLINIYMVNMFIILKILKINYRSRNRSIPTLNDDYFVQSKQVFSAKSLKIIHRNNIFYGLFERMYE